MESHLSWISAGAVLAVGLVIAVAQMIRRARRIPKIIIYAKRDSVRPKVVRLIVENIGGAKAKDLRFTFTEPLPTAAPGSDDTPEAERTPGGPLSNGITLLSPGAKRVVFWGLYEELRRAMGDRVISVTTTFESDPDDVDEITQYSTESSIELTSLGNRRGRKKKRGSRGWHKV